MTNTRTRPLIKLAAVAALAGAALIPAPAKAWFRGGVFIGFPPVVIGPPVVAYPPAYYPPAYYPPPYYAPGYYGPDYPPPAASYAPPPDAPPPQMSQADVPFGTTCYAGVYVCRAPAQSHVDSGCSCPGVGAPSYGVVR